MLVVCDDDSGGGSGGGRTMVQKKPLLYEDLAIIIIIIINYNVRVTSEMIIKSQCGVRFFRVHFRVQWQGISYASTNIVMHKVRLLSSTCLTLIRLFESFLAQGHFLFEMGMSLPLFYPVRIAPGRYARAHSRRFFL